MNKDLTIDDLKKLAGIGDAKIQPKAFLFVPQDNDVAEMENILGKLKVIEGSDEEDWSIFNIGGVKYRAMGVTKDKPTPP